MKRLMVIEDTPGQGLLPQMLKKFFKHEEYYITGGKKLKKILEEEAPEIVLLDIKKPVNGDDYDVMSQVSLIDEYYRLRVVNIELNLKPVFYISPVDVFNFAFSLVKNSKLLKKKEALIKE